MLEQALLYTVVPAAIGLAIGLAFLFLASREFMLEGETRARFTIFAAMPATGVVLSLVAAMQASAFPELPRAQLMAIGAGAFVCCAGQGALGSRALPRIVREPETFGRALIPLAALELLVVLPFLWLQLGIPEA